MTTEANPADAAWFLSGTCILTDRGEMPVEALRVGTHVFTRSGTLRPVRRIGTCIFDAGTLGSAGGPVRICHGALGTDTPYRDLFVAPAHAVEINGHLVAAGLLVNGLTITQNPVTAGIECVHLELDAHDCVLADWAWAETHRGRSEAAALPRIIAPTDSRLPGLRAGIAPALSPYAAGSAMAAVRRWYVGRGGLAV